jgi:hypothetical protein
MDPIPPIKQASKSKLFAPAPAKITPGIPPVQMPTQDPLDYSAHYNTPIPPDRQAAFNQWVATHTQAGRNPLKDRYDYDVNGYFLSGQATDPRGHATDQFKKPNHPTFSNESIYHGKDGNYGGRWINSNGGSFYEPSAQNIRLHGIDKLRQYFQRVESETQLLAPPASPQQIGSGILR